MIQSENTPVYIEGSEVDGFAALLLCIVAFSVCMILQDIGVFRGLNTISENAFLLSGKKGMSMQDSNDDKYKKLYNKVKKLLKNNSSAKNKFCILADNSEVKYAKTQSANRQQRMPSQKN